MSHRHRRALDVPAGPARPDRGLPDWFAGLRGLPEREVADVVLGVLVGLDALADPHLLRIEAGEPAVRGPRRDPEEDRAVVGPVGMLAREERLDQGDDIVDVCRRPGQDIGAGHPEGLRVDQEPLRPAVRELGGPDPGCGRALDDLVVDVRDVHDPRHPQAAPTEVADEDVGVEEAPEVPDMHGSVDGRAAAVHPDVARLERLERPRLARQRVVEADHRLRTSVATARAEIPRPAPSIPTKLPVDALTLTRSGSTQRRSAMRARIWSSRSARRGRAATIVTSTWPMSKPAVLARVMTSTSSSPLSMPRGV